MQASLRYLFATLAFIFLFFTASLLLFGKVEAASGGGPKGGLNITATSLPGWVASAGETFSVTVRISDFSTGGSTTISTSSIGGASFSPSSMNTTIPALGNRDVIFSITAPSEGTNSCPVGRNSFEIRFSSPDYGWSTQTIQLYASVGLTVTNSRSTSVTATITYTSWGGLTGQTFNVGAGGANGPSHRWAVNCATYPTATIGVTVDGVTYYGSAGTINGCSFQVTINIPVSGGAPSPTPTPPPGVTPPRNLSATPNCFGAVPVVLFNWTLGSSSQIYIDVSDNNWSSFHNRNMGNNTSLNWNPWDPMADGFAPTVNRTYQWRLWDGTQHTYGPNLTTGSCSTATPTPSPSPTVPPGTCPVGCTGPSQSVSWSRPTGHVTFADAGSVTSTCSSTGTSCSSGAVFWPGSSIIYNVRLSGSSGIIVKTGGTNAGSDARASANWDWDYDIVWCEVPGSTDTSCFGNPTVQRGNLDNNTASSPSFNITGLRPNQYYAYQIEVQGTSSNREIRNGNFRSGGCGCPVATPTPAASPTPPPGVPAIPTASVPSVPTCVNAGQTYGPTLTLNWSSSANTTTYTVRFTSISRTSGDFATKTVGSTSTTGTSGWSTGGNPLVTWVSSNNLALQPNVTYFFAVKAVGPGGDSGYDLVGRSAQVGPVPLCGPAAPSNLTALTSCDPATGNAEIVFTFRDNSTNEELFWVDVNSSPWTGVSGPSPWGFKTLNASTGSGSTVTWVWTIADPLAGGPPNTPQEVRTYYWRVRAHNNGGDSPHVYPANSATPPGISVTTLDCPDAQFDLSANIVPGSWRNSRGISTQTFDVGELVRVNVEVRNNSVGDSPQTKLYFFYDGSGLPSCPSPPGSAVTTPPSDGVGNPREFDVPSIDGSGTSGNNRVEITVSFNVSSTPTPSTVTARGYVVPSCSYLPALGEDPNFANNETGGFSYDVLLNKFFESKGGDVGAVGEVRVGFKSADIVPPSTPKYQSDYVIAANQLHDNATSKSNMTMKNYTNSQVPSGGIYNFFVTRLKDQGTTGCALTPGINRCIAAVKTFAGADTVPSGDTVMIIEGDLNIKKNLALPDPGSTITFIVSGNITIDTNVVRADGIYIARKGFYDANTSDPGVLFSGALRVNGGVYADCEDGGQVSLKRYFIQPFNNINASNVFTFEPKYLGKLQSLLGFNSIVWREVEP